MTATLLYFFFDGFSGVEVEPSPSSFDGAVAWGPLAFFSGAGGVVVPPEPEPEEESGIAGERPPDHACGTQWIRLPRTRRERTPVRLVALGAAELEIDGAPGSPRI